MKTTLRFLALGLVLGSSASCKNTQNAVVPPSFDRASRVALGCYERTGDTGYFLPLIECEGLDNATDDDTDPKRKGARHHIALVLQTARGEVGAVDIQAQQAIDSNPFVPGYTFIRVGEVPSAVVLPPERPSVTFVASFGSQTIESIDSTRFIPGSVPQATTTPAPNALGLDGGPTDLAYFEVGANDADARFLYATLPETGAVVQIPVNAAGTLGAPVALTLSLIAPAATGVATTQADTMRLCPTTADTRVVTVATRAPVTLGAMPQPVRVRVVDGPSGKELLVADAALPMIHRFQLGAAGATPLAPIATATPTLDIAVTPLVPKSPTDGTATERYIYAIDATDRSVLAIDYGTTSPSFGSVISMTTGSDAHDRIPLRIDARTLEVATPSYDVENGTNLVTSARCSEADTQDRRDDARPDWLRGVFLLVSAHDGTSHVVDVHDLEADCRGGTLVVKDGVPTCDSPVNENDDIVEIRRHLPRIGTFTSVSPALSGQPSSVFGTSSTRIDDTGEAVGSEGPGFEMLTCNDGNMTPAPNLSGIYPEGDTSLVCLTPDPWLARNQRWTATYEGELPNARGGAGRLATSLLGNPGEYFIASDIDFCRVGTVGSADVTASALTAEDPERGYPGDLLVITGEMPPSTIANPDCAKFVIPERDTRNRIAFEITEATPTALKLGPVFGATSPDSIDTTFAEVLMCFPEPTTYSIHARSTYVVVAAFTTPQHRVVTNAGTCRIDATGFVATDYDTYKTFRAFLDRPFITPELKFHIKAPTGALTAGLRSNVSFIVTQIPTKLSFDAGSLIESMLFDETSDVLYVVDSSNTGLSMYEVAPIVRQFSIF